MALERKMGDRRLEIGQSLTLERVFSQEDFDSFALLSGDDNPIHVDPVFSAHTKFGKTVAHGMLLYSTICAGISKWFPGGGFVQLLQELMFPTPTFVNERIEIRLGVSAFPSTDTVEIVTSIVRPNGKLGCTGKTTILRPEIEIRFAERENRMVTAESVLWQHRGLALGQRASRTSVFSEDPGGDLDTFLALVDDGNLLFIDGTFARAKGLENVMLPGGLLGGMISDLLGTHLPGRGTNWLKQRFSFPKPAHPNSKITADVEITRLRPEKDLVNLRTTCVDPTGDTVLEGEALVWVSDLERSS